MSGNAQKTHLARTLNRFAEQKVIDVLAQGGKSLPCRVTAVTGSIVTVKFELDTSFTLPEVTCPMFGPEYIRYPTRVGDLGIVISADVYIGGISGLGGGTADFTPQSNLSALIFLPIASTAWSPTDDPNAVVIYGPNGAVIRTVSKNTTLTVSADGVTIDTDETVAITSDDDATIESDGDTLTVGSGKVKTSGIFEAGNGATGSFIATGKTVTVSKGIVVSIV